jgi:hypothetical protein
LPHAREKSQRHRPLRNFLIIEYRSFADAILPARGAGGGGTLPEFPQISGYSHLEPLRPIRAGNFVHLARCKPWNYTAGRYLAGNQIDLAVDPSHQSPAVFLSLPREIPRYIKQPEPLARLSRIKATRIDSDRISGAPPRSPIYSRFIPPFPFAGRLAYPVESPKRLCDIKTAPATLARSPDQTARSESCLSLPLFRLFESYLYFHALPLLMRRAESFSLG